MSAVEPSKHAVERTRTALRWGVPGLGEMGDAAVAQRRSADTARSDRPAGQLWSELRGTRSARRIRCSRSWTAGR